MTGVAGEVLTIVISMGMSALGTVVVLKANMAWHKEKLDRHSASLARAFEQVEELRRELHQVQLDFYRRKE